MPSRPSFVAATLRPTQDATSQKRYAYLISYVFNEQLHQTETL